MDWRRLGAGDGGRAEARPSASSLFYAVLIIRWLSLALTLSGYLRNQALANPELDYGRFAPAFAIAVVYLLILTVFARRAYETYTRSAAILSVDFAVSFALMCLAKDVWNPLFLFVLGSAMLAGLTGSLASGATGAFVLILLYLVSLQLRGIAPDQIMRGSRFALVVVYNLEILVFSSIWAYGARLISETEDAVAQAAARQMESVAANRDLDRRDAELRALHEIRRALLDCRELSEVETMITGAALRAGFGPMRIWLRDEEGGDPLGADLHDDRIAAAVRDQVVAVFTPMGGDADEADGFAPGGDGGAPEGERLTAVIPVLGGGETFGAIVVERETDGSLSEEDLGLLRLLADEVALAVRQMRLAREGREYAVVAERNRIAIEIHDSVIQKVYGANLLAGSLTPESVGPERADALLHLQRAVVESLRELRIAVLNWESLGWGLDTVDTLRRYVDSFGALLGIPVGFSVEGRPRDLTPAKVADVLHILYEALSNAWHHSGAENVAVKVTFEPDGSVLTVTDDGCGFDVEADPGRWFGLWHIREITGSRDGEITLTSAPGAGTEVRVWLPC